MLEEKIEEVLQKETQQKGLIEKHQRDLGDIIQDIDSAIQMIDLKMRAEKKTKFVQYYPDMVKQAEKVFNHVSARDVIGDVDSNSVNIETPPFEYHVISQQEFEEFQVLRQQREIERVDQEA